MTYLENLLATVFSGDVGLSDRGIQSALSAIRDNPDRREFEGIREELRSMLDDEGVDWVRLLENDKYEVICSASQEEARKYVVDNIWKPLFSES
jgi:hypothetical protein